MILGRLFQGLVSHPVAVVMVSIAALVFGWVSYQRLPVELMPDLSYPTLTVRTTYEGAAPAEVESQISRPIEESLSTLDGLVSIESRSRAGASDVILGFDWGSDMSKASQTVRESLQVSFLPAEADRPLLLHFDPSLDPILRIALAFEPDAVPEDLDKGLTDLREMAEQDVKRALESMDGVAAVRIRGGLEREIRVEVREDWLAARGVTLDQVSAVLAAENVNIAGGSILQGDTEYLVRTLNEYTTVRELEQLGIRRADGIVVPMTDIATVTSTHRKAEVIARLDGAPALELEVFRSGDSNIVAVADRVTEALFGGAVSYEQTGEGFGDMEAVVDEGIVGDLADGVVLRVLDDQAAFIEQAVANLRNTAILGGLFAIGILFLFLRDFRSTLIIGLSIPVSVICAFAPLYVGGVSLNLMSLGGLALGVGMLVDNAVVVLESIQRYRDGGYDRFDAAVHGASDVATAVTASTLTTVAVFLPIAFVDGVAGQLFGDLAIAVVSSLLASLVVALFLVPTLAAVEWRDETAADGVGAIGVLASPGRVRGVWGYVVREPWVELKQSVAWARERRRRWLFAPYALARAAFVAFVRATSAVFAGAALLAGGVFAVTWRWIVTPAARVAMWVADRFNQAYDRFDLGYRDVLDACLRRPGAVALAAVVVLVISVRALGMVGSELIPEVHQGRFTVQAALPVGTPLHITNTVVREAEDVVRSHPEVLTVYASVGADVRADADVDEGSHSARLRVQLTPGGDLAAREARIGEDLRQALANRVPELEVRVSRPALFSFRTPLEVVVTGWDLDQLKEVGDDVVERLDGVPGLRDVQSSLVRGHPGIVVRYDRQRLRRFGLDPGTVAARVRDKVQGTRATRIRQGDERVDLRVQLVQPDRASLAELRRINVNPELVPPIPLDVVADVFEQDGPSEIRRVNQQRAVVVGANVEGFDLGSTASRVEGALVGLSLAEDMNATVSGQSREMEASLGSLQFALLLAVFLVYVIMASTFESIVQPFVILFTVPLAIFGVALALIATDLSVSVVVLIGMIVLAGVVVNNAIVLVDTINRLRAEGHDRALSIQGGAALRLRPILITTATTVLGLFPLALGFGAGSEVQQPLAVTVIGGLLSSTMLTLVVIPVAYGWVTRFGPAVVAGPVEGDMP